MMARLPAALEGVTSVVAPAIWITVRVTRGGPGRVTVQMADRIAFACPLFRPLLLGFFGGPLLFGSSSHERVIQAVISLMAGVLE
jgi:hypothetical protein